MTVKFSPAREQTKTPEFKAWFGEWDHPKAFTSKFPADLTPPSMAMDWEENKPLVLFHATNNDFNEFEVAGINYVDHVWPSRDAPPCDLHDA